ncbi:MAG: metalloregulator ArsR/SmtB family transcription factor [Clostridiales Family XIII bacterium]|jgi:ArsR family transcriptional regulator|nr:metalloregulator ArsR/SmtB family transcription factor [Clostridiales Family XIII bacterium]
MASAKKSVINLKDVRDDIFTDRCDCDVIHEDAVERARENMPNPEVQIGLAELFKVFGDPTRVRILCALRQGEMCVCDIAFLLGMTKSAISHQLRVLRQTNLVKYRKDGKTVYYSLDDDHVAEIIDVGAEHVKHTGAL